MTTDVVPTVHGYEMPGGGATMLMPQPAIRRASTAAAGKLYPWWGVGGGAPTVGAPVGYTNHDGRWSAMHMDPYAWFAIAKYIRSAAMMVIGLNGLGKSTLIKRILTVNDAWYGILNWVMGDVKGEYVDLIRKLGGVIVSLGRGRDGLNPLDMGDAPEAARRVIAKAWVEKDAVMEASGRQLLLDAKLRRRLFVEALFTAQNGTEPSGYEVTLLGVALGQLDREWAGDACPILSDLLDVFLHPTEALLTATLCQGDLDKYRLEVAGICRTLVSLTGDEDDLGMGAVFNRQSTTQWPRDRHVCIDLSNVHKDDRAVRGALQMGSWIAGSGAIAVNHVLSEAGLEDFHRYCTTQDELWDAFSTGHGMVERHNQLTRLDRHQGRVTIKCTHSLGDNKMLSDEDQAKALGMVQRTPLLVCFALDPLEAQYLDEFAVFTPNETKYLVEEMASPQSWTAPIADAAPGTGACAVKLQGRPMLPFQVMLSPTEEGTSFTNQAWTQG